VFFRHPSIHPQRFFRERNLTLETRDARRATSAGRRTTAERAREFPFVSVSSSSASARAHRRSRRSRPASWWVSPHPSSRGNLARHSSIHPSIHLARSRRRDDDERVDRDATHRVLLLKSTPHPLHPLPPRVRRLRAPSVRPSVRPSTLVRCFASPPRSTMDDGLRTDDVRRPTSRNNHPRTNERTNAKLKNTPSDNTASDDHRPTSRSDARPMDDRCVGTRAPTVSTASARAFRHEFFSSKRFGLLDRTLIVLNR